ncbi:MAG: glycosyltransferase, partial [Acidimicrobiia bacterium]|nr:glycosyltransferase [Acidimicrobiia bacterium]
MAWFDPPSTASFWFFLFGWAAGWIVFARSRLLPVRRASRRAAASVIVPCRNEAANLSLLLPTLRSSLNDSDEIIVVDDESTDDTVAVAAHHGAVVFRAGALPSGWTGKAHA